MTLLNGLNEAQRRAVEATEGPVLIIAGAGAGKTKTLVHRIAHIIWKGVPASEILAVTFTNKAAKEMRERALALLKEIDSSLGGNSAPFISTFHSLGVFLLRRFGAYNKTLTRFSVLDEGDSLSLIKEALLSLGLDPKSHDPRGLRALISKCANAMQSPEDLLSETNPTYRTAGRVWEKYKRLKQQTDALDFDDLLLETFILLKDEEVRSWCHNTWSYVHIDEYQDTNEVQYLIAKALTGDAKNICVVGDSDQSIYSWRGANIKNILEFERDYPEATVVLLEENYRSTKTVLDAANEIIKKNVHRTPKHLFTKSDHGEKASLYGGYDEVDEARFIVERCIEEVDKGVSPEEIAVLYRANFQSRVLEEAFLSYGLPYQMLGTKFFERKEVKDVLAYLRAALNQKNTLDIKRTINTPTRGVGKVTMEKIFSGGKESLSGKIKLAVDTYYDLLEKISTRAHSQKVSETIKFIITSSGLDTYYKTEPDGDERLENLKELVTLSLKYDSLPPIAGADRLIEDAALASDQDSLGEKNTSQNRGVKLMTVHASKGLEFHTVFITGLEHGLFPHERGEKLTGADAEEERRLMYVALTRARKKLYLTYASIRTIYGMRDIRLPSEFLSDIPDELIQRESRDGESGFGTVFL